MCASWWRCYCANAPRKPSERWTLALQKQPNSSGFSFDHTAWTAAAAAAAPGTLQWVATSAMMPKHVSSQVAGLTEAFVAYLTLIRLLACVRARVLRQYAAVAVAFVAYFTLIRLLACVRAHVPGQDALQTEALEAYFALKRLLPRMCRHVFE